jgi:hypothetical protein
VLARSNRRLPRARISWSTPFLSATPALSFGHSLQITCVKFEFGTWQFESTLRNSSGDEHDGIAILAQQLHQTSVGRGRGVDLGRFRQEDALVRCV